MVIVSQRCYYVNLSTEFGRIVHLWYYFGREYYQKQNTSVEETIVAVPLKFEGKDLCMTGSPLSSKVPIPILKNQMEMGTNSPPSLSGILFLKAVQKTEKFVVNFSAPAGTVKDKFTHTKSSTALNRHQITRYF